MHEIQDKAAVIEFLANCAAESNRIPENHVFNGIGDICGELTALPTGSSGCSRPRR